MERLAAHRHTVRPQGLLPLRPLAADVLERAAVARECCHSRVLYQSGAWPLLSASLFKKVAVAYHRPLRVMCGAHRPPLEGFVQESNESVRQKVQSLPL